jgi:predicted Zn finger-like uncharacterized protein
MLIVCPNCATSYAVTAQSLGPAGRNVRCARCQTQWLATATRDVSVNSFVDDVIAEANARRKPRPAVKVAAPQSVMPAAEKRNVAAPPVPPTPIPAQPAVLKPVPVPQPEPVAQLPQTADEVAQFTAALDEVSAVPPMAAQDIVPMNEDAAPAIDIGEAPALVPPDAPPAHDIEDIEHFASRRAARQKAQKKRKRAAGIPAFIILLSMIAGAIVVWRNDLVRHMPQTASLFSAIGLPVNVRNLVFEDVVVSKEVNDGVTVLLVEGKIVSIANKPNEVPRLRFAVRNTSGNEIYSWTAQPPRSILGAGESVSFRSRLASPPPEANDVLVRFFTSRDLAIGSK